MVKRALGKTGIHVSEVAFGCVEIGMPYGIGINSEQDMLSEYEAIHLLQTALTLGINFFDTARAYGNSESIIGKAFRHHRSEVIIATKCTHFQKPNGDIPPYNELKLIIETSLQESLMALQTNYVDVYMLHQADERLLRDNNVQAIFADLRNSGLIKATGVSTYTNEQTQLAIDAGCWDVIQVPFNMMDQRQSALFDKAVSQGIGLIIRSVLLKGLLSDRGKNLHPALSQVEAHIQKYNTLTQSLNVTLPALATQFALSFPQISAILVGIDKLDFLEQSVDVATRNPLHQETLQQIKDLAYPEPDFINLPMWDREGWLT
ncbi:aldo/keto reductase [Mucilaginibacter sp. CSA2-8R]|uniref:aldo/keto reductase n=1 Tax=Mucilaginibacter sp. CSA2-8R TaxID=3141542 RepID=UPI00315D44BE